MRTERCHIHEFCILMQQKRIVSFLYVIHRLLFVLCVCAQLIKSGLRELLVCCYKLGILKPHFYGNGDSVLVGKKTWLCIYEPLTFLSFRIVSVEHSCLGKVLERKSCQVLILFLLVSLNSWRETLRQTSYFKGELVCRAGRESGHVNLHAKQTT